MQKVPSLVFILFFLVLLESKGQQPTGISFLQPIADLGTVPENEGIVNHRFEFTNLGPGPLQIENVSASCGCTTSDWSSQPVSAGEKGFVEVQFDPQNRPGPFDKMVTVLHNGQPSSVTLHIRGFVNYSPASIEEQYPVQLGQLRLKNKFLHLGNITTPALYSKSFEVYNQGNSFLVFADEMEGPNHITVTFEPYTLKPGGKGRLWVHYDVKAKSDLGYFREDIAIFTYEQEDERKELIVTSTILDIPTYTNSSGPRISAGEVIKDFGIKQQGDTVKVTFPLLNTGQETLHIKKAFGNCNCIRVQLSKTKLKPGEAGDIHAVFLTDERVGNQQKSITVFTNDPQQPVTILTIKGLLRGPRN